MRLVDYYMMKTSAAKEPPKVRDLSKQERTFGGAVAGSALGGTAGGIGGHKLSEKIRKKLVANKPEGMYQLGWRERPSLVKHYKKVMRARAIAPALLAAGVLGGGALGAGLSRMSKRDK